MSCLSTACPMPAADVARIVRCSTGTGVPRALQVAEPDSGV
jgi:hypothetical protein